MIVSVGFTLAAEPQPAEYSAADTIPAKCTDGKPDAAACLNQLTWQPGQFTVRVEPTPEKPYDFLVRFPTPHASGNRTNDMVAIEWYAARDEAGQLISAPAVVVVHESGSAMEIGQLFARSLHMKGLHAFMIQLPYYGERRGGGKGPPTEKMLATMRQGIADVRRAYDAVRVIPQVDQQPIGLQGTSLGGFVAATAGGLDACYDRVFIMLAGGELAGMIEKGEKDTAQFRDKMLAGGYTIGQIRELLWQVEPTRLAHRLPSKTTWLYSAMYDRVVPLDNGIALAKAIELEADHHVRLPGNHYSTIIYFPWIVNHIALRMQSSDAK
jgi:hypothetical protein